MYALTMGTADALLDLSPVFPAHVDFIDLDSRTRATRLAA
jgi:hypothetical protein